MYDAVGSEEGVSIREAASILGVRETTLRRRIWRGKLKAVRVERPRGLCWQVLIDQPTNQLADSAYGDAAGTLSTDNRAPVASGGTAALKPALNHGWRRREGSEGLAVLEAELTQAFRDLDRLRQTVRSVRQQMALEEVGLAAAQWGGSAQ